MVQSHHFWTMAFFCKAHEHQTGTACEKNKI